MSVLLASSALPAEQQSVAVVTPSYAGDFEICKILNRGVLSFFPAGVKHYIIVDRSDVPLFSSLKDSRVVIAAVEDIVPPGLKHIPGTRRWFARGSKLPIHGWLLQQIVKIATTEAVAEQLLIFADSDVMITREVDLTTFVRDGKPRLFCRPNGITAEMASHVEWYRNACRLFNIEAALAPMDDYIGNLVTWDRDIVHLMRAHIEKVAGYSWMEAVTRSRRCSEYLLYGIFVDRILGREGRVWADPRPLCREHWLPGPIKPNMVSEFVDSMDAEDVSVMITSHSSTTFDVRKNIFEQAQRQAAMLEG